MEVLPEDLISIVLQFVGVKPLNWNFALIFNKKIACDIIIKKANFTMMLRALEFNLSTEIHTQFLILASDYGRLEIIKDLIPISDPKANDSEALRNAANYGFKDCVKALIPVSDPKANDSEALRNAAFKGHVEIVNTLIPISDPKANHSEALIDASRNEDFPCMMALIPHSNGEDYLIEVLPVIAQYDRIDLLELIISNVSSDMFKIYGEGALLLAEKYGYHKFVYKLSQYVYCG